MASHHFAVHSLLLGGLLLSVAAAQPQPADTLHVPADSLLLFGWTVDADADRLLVGARELRPAGRSPGDPQGTAFIYRRMGTEWEVEGRLMADRLTNQDCFSWSLDLQGDRAAVGAECEFTEGAVGAVYLYRFDGAEWVREAKLRPADAGETDPYVRFGMSVALGDGYLAVGGFAANPSNPDDGSSGAVYIFEHDGGAWVHTATLINEDTDSQVNEWFSAALAASGDTLLVGAPGDDAPGVSNSGALYVFERAATQWIQREKLQATVPVAHAQFGQLLAFHGGDAVIGTSGAAVLYAASRRGAGWAVRDRLSLDGWPLSVAIHDSVILTVDSNQGYLFERTGPVWAERARFPVAPFSQWRDEMVSLNDTYAFVGRPSQTDKNYVALYERARLTARAPETPDAGSLAFRIIPNPTGGDVTLRFSLAAPAHVHVAVYDVLGQDIGRLYEGTLGAGGHEVHRSGLKLAPGVYVVRLTTGSQTSARSLTVLR